MFITKEQKHEKGNHWGLVGLVGDDGLGVLLDQHLHHEWACNYLHNLLLWSQLHNKLFLITMVGNPARVAPEKTISHRSAVNSLSD